MRLEQTCSLDFALYKINYYYYYYYYFFTSTFSLYHFSSSLPNPTVLTFQDVVSKSSHRCKWCQIKWFENDVPIPCVCNDLISCCFPFLHISTRHNDTATPASQLSGSLLADASVCTSDDDSLAWNALLAMKPPSSRVPFHN